MMRLADAPIVEIVCHRPAACQDSGYMQDRNHSDPLVRYGSHYFKILSTAGSVVINGTDTVEYDPNGQFEFLAEGETAIDQFSYTITDNNGLTDTATVIVTIIGQNDAPVAADDVAITDDKMLSSTHVRIYQDEHRRWHFEDLDSLNGTWLAIKEKQIDMSAQFQPGEQRFSIRFP